MNNKVKWKLEIIIKKNYCKLDPGRTNVGKRNLNIMCSFAAYFPSCQVEIR